jgi:hypothetical protein
MKIADLLRVLANNLDHPEGGAPDPRIQNPAGLISVSNQDQESDIESDDKTLSGNDKNPDIFLPPLQQKQELLKKAVGVENVYDDGTPSEQEEQESDQEPESDDEDIIDRIKHLSGLPVTVISALSDDEPLES